MNIRPALNRTTFVLASAVLAGVASRLPSPGLQAQPATVPATAAAASTAPERCAALTTAAFPLPIGPTRIVTSAFNSAAAAQPGRQGGPLRPALPEHCEVVGRINERAGVRGQNYAVAFRLRLPTDWNGRFFFQGGGGTNGSIGDGLGALQGQQPGVALTSGYAVVTQDSGHDNTTNNDPAVAGAQSFGFDPQARSDFGYNSYDQVTRTAKAIVRQFYGRAPEKSYFVGCSEGGREGLMVSQRFPEHFDGILSCDPGLHLPRAAAAQAFDSQMFATVAREQGLVDANGHPFLNKTFTDDDLALVAAAVASACDGLDGLADGMVQQFTACTSAVVAPALARVTCAAAKADGCLSATQVKALTSIFDGLKSASGDAIYTPWPWDVGIGGKTATGFNNGWRLWKLGAYSASQNSGLNTTLGGGALAAVFSTPPAISPATGGGQAAFVLGFNLENTRRLQSATTAAYREAVEDYMRADRTDLSAFRRHGGRLIVVHGASDPVFSILDTVAWFTEVTRANATAASFVRFFAVPGMNHCNGGPSTDRFDAFGALVAWVERGTAPDRIVATAGPNTPWPGRTRPLCPFPAVARYNGNGSIEEAASFSCR